MKVAKALSSKALAEHFRQIKYTQLNSDVFTGTVTVDWPQMRDEYVHSKKVAGSVEASIYEVALTLRHFERLVGKCNSKQIKQNTIEQYPIAPIRPLITDETQFVWLLKLQITRQRFSPIEHL
ncbi:MAG: hypothetical protein FVQ84_08150 [Planctomycetes bacterium]|nr:hypothetical protein [Planctomycetota bacterium]